MDSIDALPPKHKLKAYLARLFPSEFERLLEERYEVTRNPSGGAMGAQKLMENAGDCDYLFVSATEHVTREVFEHLDGTLKAVATLSVGFNHIDLEAARAHGVAVFHSPGVLSNDCADIGMLLLLNAARRGYEADQMVRSGSWQGWAPTQLLGIRLWGTKLGILGMGRIGQAVAHRARAFGMQVHYHNRRRYPVDEENGAIYHDTVEGLLSEAEAFMITAPGSRALQGFLNRERIALLPPNAIVINIARGELIDDDALIEALARRRIFAAGLDVFNGEPRVDPRYAALPNVFLTPHIGSATEATRNAMGFVLLDGLVALENGQFADNRLC